MDEFPEARLGDVPLYDFQAQSFYIRNLKAIFSLSAFTQMTSFHPPSHSKLGGSTCCLETEDREAAIAEPGPSALGRRMRRFLVSARPWGRGLSPGLAPCLSLLE